MPDKKPDPMQELKGMHIWMLWEWAADKDGKMTKKPFAANGRACGTDEKFSGKWVTYDEAVAAMKKFPGRAAGVGFKIPGGYFFLDVDDKALEDPYVQTLLRRFASYAEISVSGDGTHIYGKYDLSQIPTYIRRMCCPPYRSRVNGTPPPARRLSLTDTWIPCQADAMPWKTSSWNSWAPYFPM